MIHFAHSVLRACASLALAASTGCAVSPGAAPAAAPEPPQPDEGTWVTPSATERPSATFLLDGAPWCFHGANNYYLTFKSKVMMDSVFENARKLGLQVLRHWAFTDRGSLDGRVPSVDGDGTKEGVYFQYWDVEQRRPAYNDGADGLQRLDELLARARESGIRVLLVLTNNWHHFGGMDQYLTWYGLERHPQFYTDERVKKAYKDWALHLLSRVNTVTGIAYKDDPTIFGWELANEPRVRNHTRFDAAEGWEPDTITRWAEEMSEFIRAIDPHHLISVGDEGFFSRDSEEALYKGEDGVDHDALLALPQIDFGTFHLYPDHWSKAPAWGSKWILDHIDAARAAGKPTVLEEYGVMVDRDEHTFAIVRRAGRRERAYRNWNETLMLGGGAASMFWLLAGYDDVTRTNYKDYDRFSVYSPDTDPSAQLLRTYAQRFTRDAQACILAKRHPAPAKRAVPPGFVTVSTLE